jgi:hypothetical protein
LGIRALAPLCCFVVGLQEFLVVGGFKRSLQALKRPVVIAENRRRAIVSAAPTKNVSKITNASIDIASDVPRTSQVIPRMKL